MLRRKWNRRCKYFTANRKGVPDITGYGTGDILAVTDIYIPSKLTKEEQKALESIKDSENLKPKKNNE